MLSRKESDLTPALAQVIGFFLSMSLALSCVITCFWCAGHASKRITPPDMTRECIRCSQTGDSDSCVPSLCEKRGDSYCCASRLYPQ